MSRPMETSASATRSTSGRAVRRRRRRTTSPRSRSRARASSPMLAPSRLTQPGRGRSSRASTRVAVSALSAARSEPLRSETAGSPGAAGSPSSPASVVPASPLGATVVSVAAAALTPERVERECSSRAHAHRPARSAAPNRTTGPVSSRMSWSPRVGSCTTHSAATRSLTSGVTSRPPSPTTSTGRWWRRRASSTRGKEDRRRHSTAALKAPSGCERGRHSAAISSAIAAASSSSVTE